MSNLQNKTPFYLVTGFLGSGKTTFLKNVINHFQGKKKMAIVQNEFAPANFDGKELKRITHHDFDLLEINNGSVFCVCLLSGFVISLEKFLSTCQPEIIFMEASGLSDPVNIGEILHSEKLKDQLYLAGIISIIDTMHFLKLEPMQQRIKHQVIMADHIIINKSDQSEHLDIIKTKVSDLNPFGIQYITSYCMVPLEDILHSKMNKSETPLFLDSISGRPDIVSVVLKTSKPVKKERLVDLIRLITKNVIRMKGYILLDNGEIMAVQTIYNEIKTERIDKNTRQTELIALGYNLQIKLFKEKYDRFI